MLSERFVLLTYFCLGLLSFIVFAILTHKYFSDKNKHYKMPKLTRILAIFLFFIFVDNLYYFLLYGAQYGLFPLEWFFSLLDPIKLIIPKISLFLVSVFLVYFIFEKSFDELQDKEASFNELEILNQELRMRAKEMEISIVHLQKKVHELERFNDIARERETEIVQLIKKIEKLENQMRLGILRNRKQKRH